MPQYSELFRRNAGILSEEQQERLRRARVLIVGCGGIGGTVAVILARSGVGGFELVDYDTYEASNMNRQISCTTENLGRKKTDVLREEILRINPEASVRSHPRLLTHARIAALMADCNLVFPAADDFAFSLMVFRDAARLGKPALFVVPSGTWANVSLIFPGGPSVEDIQGIPKLSNYEEYRELFETRKYRYGNYFYVQAADWRKEYFKAFMDEDAPVAQLCPWVWIAASLGAAEVVKHLTGLGKPVRPPRYYRVGKTCVRLERMNGPSFQTLAAWERRFFYRLFQTPLAPILEKAQEAWWRLFFEKP